MVAEIRFFVNREAHPDYDPIIHVRRPIAFFPEEGFAAFEGYGSICAENLPCLVDVWDMMTHKVNPGAFFQIRVLASYKKGLPTEENCRAILQHAADAEAEAEAEEAEEAAEAEEAKDHGESDKESETSEEFINNRICFFPNNQIVIYRFEVATTRDNPSIPLLRYNIDDRFDTVEGQIEAYLSLPDLPDHCYGCEPRLEDVPFFEGYHATRKKDENQYEADWNAAYTFVRTLYHSRDYSAMDAMLREWNTRYSERTLDSTTAFLSWIRNHLGAMKEWCADYLRNMTLRDKLRAWLTYGVEQRASGAYFTKHWQLFFRSKEADLVTLDGDVFDISYPHAQILLKRMQKEAQSARLGGCSSSLHEGIPCNNTSTTFCMLCEEKRILHAADVYRTYRQGSNIFVNWNLGKMFVSSWLRSVSKMTEEQKAAIHYVWPPKVVYHRRDYGIFGGGQEECTRDEFLAVLTKERQMLYDPQLPREPEDAERFVSMAMHLYRLPDGLLAYEDRRWNEVYLFLARFLSYAPALLTLDSEMFQRRG